MEVVVPSSRASGRKVEIAFAAKALPTSSGDAVEPEIASVAGMRRLDEIAYETEIAERAIVQRRETMLSAFGGQVALPERDQAVQKGRAAGSLQRRRMGGACHDGILSEAGADACLVRMKLGQTLPLHKAEDCHLP